MIDKRQETRPFGKYLRGERLRLDMNQAALAEVGGVSKATQVAYEANATRPDAAYLARVAASGVDVCWLLTGRRATGVVQWELLFDILALIEEWMSERGYETPVGERNDLLRMLYGQFCTEGQIDHDQLATMFRLVR